MDPALSMFLRMVSSSSYCLNAQIVVGLEAFEYRTAMNDVAVAAVHIVHIAPDIGNRLEIHESWDHCSTE